MREERKERLMVNKVGKDGKKERGSEEKTEERKRCGEKKEEGKRRGRKAG